MFKIAINRPITTLVFFITLILFGIISVFIMPINSYPKVSIPLVKISSSVNGDINFVESKVTKEVENALTDIDGIKTINSASYDNFSVSVVEFHLDKNLEIATNDVRDKLSAINLPVKPKVEKIASDGGSVLSLFLYSQDQEKLMRFIHEKIKPFILRIKGVGKVKETGFLKPAVRIKLNPSLLEKYHLNALEVARLIKSQNFTQALGELENSEQNYLLKGHFEAKSLDELKNLRLMSGVFLSDVAEISTGFEDKKQIVYYENEGVLLEIGNISGENALETIKNIKNQLNNLHKLAGKDIQISIVYDKSENIKKHLNQVITELILGIVLTMIIVFLFLRNLSATLIASVAIPASIIGTFFLIYLFGHDLNRLSFIALILSIGIFVDDAIVVIENIARKMNEMPPFMAAFLGIKEIGFSVLSISVVLLCVFVPVAYMNSITGLFFNALGISVASGVVISFLVAVFLIPSLSARFFNPKKSSFYEKTEYIYQKIELYYTKLLSKILNNEIKFIITSFVVIGFCFFLATRLGLDFLPMEDDSEFQVMIENKEDLSLEKMKNLSLEILKQIKQDERVSYAYLLVGYTDAKEARKAKIYVKLKPLSQRKQRQPQIIQEYSKKDFSQNHALDLSSLKIKILELPKFEGAGIDDPVQFVVLGDDLDELLQASKRAKEVLASNEEITAIDDNTNSKKAEIAVFINNEKAKKLNISTQYVAEVLAYSFAMQSVGTMDMGQSSNDIILSFDSNFKQDIQALKQIKIKNNDGLIFDLSTIADFSYAQNLSVINRYNKSRAVKVTANNGDLSLSSVKKLILSHVDEITQGKVDYAFSGFINLLNETIIGFLVSIGLAFMLVYLILAALYESLILPLIIMLTMPLAFAGACFGLFITGNNFSLFVLIALILLFGMVGKNAILLVDVANKKCNEGKDVKQALIEAGNLRLRAILMTTFAMIFAMLPMALSQGSGFESNSPMAVAVIFGLLSSTALTLLVIPALFESVYKLDKKIRKIYQRKKI